jgi:hypothetical protein
MDENLCFQIRARDHFGNERVVHGYQSEEQAKQAIQMMKPKTRLRYIIVPVKDQPDQHWSMSKQ